MRSIPILPIDTGTYPTNAYGQSLEGEDLAMIGNYLCRWRVVFLKPGLIPIGLSIISHGGLNISPQ